MRRVWAGPLVPVYWAGVSAKNLLYDRGLLRVRRLGWPVVSVGSLSAGGAGKTPVVMMLAELLRGAGIECDVLSRGYGRESGMVEEVDAQGDARRFGDEPMEMARAGLRVWVGGERWAAGRAAEGAADDDGEPVQPQIPCGNDNQIAKVHLVDDGFQHRRLGRDLDVVLLTVEDVRDGLLPAGNLREGLRSLRRAGVVVVREEEEAELRLVIARHTKAEVWVVRRELVLPVAMPSRPLVFCGIARPEGFLRMLEAAGVQRCGTVKYADHHAFTTDDFYSLQTEALLNGDGYVTTAKDAVKISPAGIAVLQEVGPVAVAMLKVRLLDEAAALGMVRRACGF